MDLINISDAKAHLSAIIEQVVTSGEDCLIGKAGKPIAKIVRYEPARKHKRLGLFKGKIKLSQDWDSWPDDIAQSLGIK